MKILIATDGSVESSAAARQIALRPWPQHSQARVLSVAQSLYLAASAQGINSSVVHELETRTDAEAQSAAAAAAAVLESAGLSVKTAIRRGDPRVEILEEAAQWEADIIVVGSHGRTGLKRWLLGSVAEYVVRHARCSVEVARAKAGGPAG